LGKALFFFGCRKEAADFLYAEEWEELVSQEVLSTFAVAFSRDQNRKIYVQDKMQEFGEEIFDVICRNEGCFFLSGCVPPLAVEYQPL
jgi:NADPH-ferrihemoprotein reductase